jgi:rod shape-determining protein MreD
MAAAAGLYLAATLQTSTAAHLAIGPAAPDFLLVAVISIGLLRGPTTGVWAGFGGGLFLGLLESSAGLLIAVTIAAMLAGMLAGYQRRWLRVEHWLAAPLTTLWVTLLASAVVWLLSHPAAIGHGIEVSAASAPYNAVIALPVFALARWADTRLRPAQV